MTKRGAIRPSLHLSTLICTALFAQDNTPFDPSDTQMMQKVQGVQACMSKIDFNELSAMQKETLWLSMKIKDMCTLDKRDQAEKEA